jgi:hypothetical protein
MKGLDKSKITPVRGRAGLSKYDQMRRSLSNSVDRAPSYPVSSSKHNSRSREPHEAEPVIVVTPKRQEFMVEAEDFEIFGLIDDELRKVNGVMIRYYLVDWKGDFDPTWEAEYNVSNAAIKAYKKKLLRERQAFDGAIDDPEDIPASPQKFRTPSGSDVDMKTETDDTAVLTLAPPFPANGNYKEPDDSDLQAAILLENGYEDEMEPLTPMPENRRSPGQFCSI